MKVPFEKARYMENSKKMIFEILSGNDLAELYQEDETTLLEIEEFVACPKDKDNPKEQTLPLLDVLSWLSYLRSLVDVLNLEATTFNFSPSRVSKELRIALKIRIKGGLKRPKGAQEFEKAFSPLQNTLSTLLIKRLSFASYLDAKLMKNSLPPALSLFPPKETATPIDDDLTETELAKSALL